MFFLILENPSGVFDFLVNGCSSRFEWLEYGKVEVLHSSTRKRNKVKYKISPLKKLFDFNKFIFSRASHISAEIVAEFSKEFSLNTLDEVS